jgi:hypothetical protein
VVVLGCEHKFVPVSGKVTLNGKPLANATVSFQPMAAKGSVEAGPGSQGKTNAEGGYSLQASTGRNGALVGEHRVIITALAQQVGDSDERPPRGGWPLKDKVPARYNANSKETFTVPPGGTDQADFDLHSP